MTEYTSSLHSDKAVVFTGRQQGRRTFFWEVQAAGNPFKTKFCNKGRWLEKARDTIPFETLGQLKEDAEVMDAEMALLYEGDKVVYHPNDWYSIFHEVTYVGQRTKLDPADCDQRDEYLSARDMRRNFRRFAMVLSCTPVSIFGGDYTTEGGLSLLKGSEYSNAWIAANRLFGSVWQTPDEVLVAGVSQAEEEGRDATAEAQQDKDASDKAEVADAAGKDEVADAADEDKEEDQLEKEEALAILHPWSRRCLFKLAVKRRKTRNEVIRTVTVTHDQDLQHSNGFSTKARVDFLLKSFETTTGFVKVMNALELWSIVRKTSLEELAMPMSKDEISEWSITTHKALPIIVDLVPGTKTAENDTGKLRALWDNRDETYCLLDPDLKEAAKVAPRCTYKHFLTLLNQGRQLFSDFAYLYPLLDKPTVKKMVCKTFADTVKGTEFERKWAAVKLKMINALRSQASRDKKKKKEEEAKKLEAQEQEIGQKYKELEKQLNDIAVVAEAEHSKEEHSAGN